MATGMTTSGLNYLGYALVNGSTLALGTDSTTPLTTGYRNYADVPCQWGSGTSNTVAYFSATGGVLTNTNDFYFPEADDESGTDELGWGTVTHLFIRNNGTIYYTGALTTSANIAQDVQPRFSAGKIKITFTCTTITE